VRLTGTVLEDRRPDGLGALQPAGKLEFGSRDDDLTALPMNPLASGQ
jgi:hypothetical protein